MTGGLGIAVSLKLDIAGYWLRLGIGPHDDEDDEDDEDATDLTVIVPGDDVIAHDDYGTGRCICGPRWVEIHHALDGRESDE